MGDAANSETTEKQEKDENERPQTVVEWLEALHIDTEDATRYAAALKELGVDVGLDMYSLEPEDLEDA